MLDLHFMFQVDKKNGMGISIHHFNRDRDARAFKLMLDDYGIKYTYTTSEKKSTFTKLPNFL